MIAALKALHIAALLIWCAALLALPLVLRAAAPQTAAGYIRYRQVTHFGYIGFATPAAVLSVSAGTGLIFAAGVFEPWLLAKLALVAGMVLVHVWLGHLIQRAGGAGRRPGHGQSLLALVLVVPLMAAVLVLVLAKPDLRGLIPAQFWSPRGGVLP